MDRRPLAERLRPQTWDAILGHERWLGEGGLLRTAIERKQPVSVVLWGPPGCGKTTLARAMAKAFDARFVQISAVLDGVKALRQVVDEAQNALLPTVLLVDEIHRWNKAQQDALLPHVEAGTLTLIGATTENPTYELNPALRSRLQIVKLEPLTEAQVRTLLEHAATELDVEVTDEALGFLAERSGGDARRALGDLERCAGAANPIDVPTIQQLLQRADLRHDRSGEDHYNVLSALIKSMRGSDPDAAIYWLARLLAGGEPVALIARRLVIFAAEDVGNADPRALQVAVDVAMAVERTGMPEARIPLAQAVTWLATCPKSNRAYLAIDAALADVERHGALTVPEHLTTAGRKQYRYPHDAPDGIVAQQYLPEKLRGRTYYTPSRYGNEKLIAERMAWWRRKLES